MAEGEDGDADGPVGHGMDLFRATRGGEPIGDLGAVPQDAAAEHHRTRDGGDLTAVRARASAAAASSRMRSAVPSPSTSNTSPA